MLYFLFYKEFTIEAEIFKRKVFFCDVKGLVSIYYLDNCDIELYLNNLMLVDNLKFISIKNKSTYA